MPPHTDEPTDPTDPSEPLAPLAAILRRAADSGVHLGLPPELRADGDPGWRPIGADFIAAGVSATAAAYSAPAHVGAALWWKAYSYWAVLPVTLGWALNRRVPLMPSGNVVVRAEAGGLSAAVALRRPVAAVLAGDPCAGAPGTVTAPGEAALVALIRDSLVAGNLAPVVAELRAQTRVGARGLWGTAAEAFVHPPAAYGPALLGRDGAGAAAGLVAALGPPVAGLVDLLPGEPRLRRRTCCLWVTLGQEACATCCVLK